MKINKLLMAATFIATAMGTQAYACMGGDLITAQDAQGKTVISINKRTGAVTATQGIRIKSIVKLADEKIITQLPPTECIDSECTKINLGEDSISRFMITFDENDTDGNKLADSYYITEKGRVGPTTPVAKCGPPPIVGKK